VDLHRGRVRGGVRVRAAFPEAVDVNAPFYEFGALGEGASLWVALALGIAFGWFLERGGMGSAKKLAGQFYLTDMTVFKLMFSAIVTAMLGLFWLSRVGLVDLSRVYVPETYVVPQLAGGAVFGIGFVMGGLCPGTSCVAASTGRLDGLMVLAGMLAGIFAFGEAFPAIQSFYASTPRGGLTFMQLLGLPHGLLVLIVTLLALVGFAGAEWLERRAENNR
jgi:uncharacterized membrane protein YedE/YeeE